MRFGFLRSSPLFVFALLAGCHGEPTSAAVAGLHTSFPELATSVLNGARPLAAAGEGFALRDVATSTHTSRRALSVDWPRAGTGSIRVRHGDDFEVRVREIGAGGEGERVEQALVYARAGGTSFWTAASDGAEEWLMLDAAAAGKGVAAAWEITGGALRARGSSIEIVDAHGQARIRVTAPRAYAASGRNVPVHLAARGSTIELSVDGGGEAVLVDPLWAPASTMIDPRARHVAALLPDGEVLAAGGQGWIEAIASAERYDPATDTWSPAAPMSAPRDLAKGTTLADGRVLVTGGHDNVPFVSFLDTAEIYDAASDSWTLTGPMVSPRGYHAITRLADGRVLVTGGTTGYPDFISLATTEIYDPVTNAWSPAAPMNGARQSHTATLLADGRVLVAGGLDGSYLASAEIYDPATDTWTAASPDVIRYDARAALLPTGDLLVAGGDDNVASLYTASRFVASTGTWAAAPFMAVGRDRYTLTLLADGRVLAAGGTGGLGASANAEIYDAGKDAWTCAGTMIAPRYEHAATLLADGRVLLTGGENDFGVLASAEALDPADPTGCAPSGCDGGYLADGVCCKSACTGPCMACAAAHGATADGTCTALDNVPCDDGNACTEGDSCHAGACYGNGGPGLLCPPPPSECQGSGMAGMCDPMIGCAVFDFPDGTPCSIGTCLSGTCVPASTGSGGAGSGGAGGGDDDDDDDHGGGHGHSGHGNHGHHGSNGSGHGHR
ncbi:MAG: kelch repeat-containing protein [Minicystis sp.]